MMFMIALPYFGPIGGTWQPPSETEKFQMDHKFAIMPQPLQDIESPGDRAQRYRLARNYARDALRRLQQALQSLVPSEHYDARPPQKRPLGLKPRDPAGVTSAFQPPLRPTAPEEPPLPNMKALKTESGKAIELNPSVEASVPLPRRPVIPPKDPPLLAQYPSVDDK